MANLQVIVPEPTTTEQLDAIDARHVHPVLRAMLDNLHERQRGGLTEMATMHVMPTDDAINHQASDDCACLPRQLPAAQGFIAVHHAWDGRGEIIPIIPFKAAENED